MMSFYQVQSFQHVGKEKTKVKPKKMAEDFTNITNDVKNLVAAVNQYASDWGQVGQKVSSSDWAEYANNISKVSDQIAEALSDSATNLMTSLNELVSTMSGFSNKEAAQIDAAQTTMNNSLSTLQSLGGRR